MKKIFKNIRFYFWEAGLLLLGVGLPLLINGICFSVGVKNFPYPLITAIMAGIYGFLTYLSGDIVIIKYNKKNPTIYKKVLPPEVNERVIYWRVIFFVSFICALIVFVVYVIIYKATNNWPMQLVLHL